MKLTVSAYWPAARESAFELIDTVTVVVAPPARVPPVSLRVTQDWPLVTL
jgi:hypothetical protein